MEIDPDLISGPPTSRLHPWSSSFGGVGQLSVADVKKRARFFDELLQWIWCFRQLVFLMLCLKQVDYELPHCCWQAEIIKVIMKWQIIRTVMFEFQKKNNITSQICVQKKIWNFKKNKTIQNRHITKKRMDEFKNIKKLAGSNRKQWKWTLCGSERRTKLLKWSRWFQDYTLMSFISHTTV